MNSLDGIIVMHTLGVPAPVKYADSKLCLCHDIGKCSVGVRHSRARPEPSSLLALPCLDLLSSIALLPEKSFWPSRCKMTLNHIISLKMLAKSQ